MISASLILGCDRPVIPAKNGVFTPQAITGEILIEVKQGQNIKGILSSYSDFSPQLENTPLSPGVYLVRTQDPSKSRALLHLLAKNPHVDMAEPNFLLRGQGEVVNDPEFSKQWNMRKIGADKIWSSLDPSGDPVLVAVMDSGIDLNHADLAQNIYVNPGESGDKSRNGVDDDANGFVDDVQGWNFVAGNNNADDDNGHGTHCAGTIGAVGNNGVGITGISWRAQLLPIKFLDKNTGGTTARLIAAIHYARLMKARIINNSTGGSAFSKLVQKAIEQARQDGILFVSAAGNEAENIDLFPYYEASYPLDNIIRVASTDESDALAGDSSWGRKTVEIAAPGSKIWSTLPGNRYGFMSGTSMAVPHITGSAALLLSRQPTLDYKDLKNILLNSADDFGEPMLKILGGRLNLANAFQRIFPERFDPYQEKWVDVPFHIESRHFMARDAITDFRVKVPGARFIRVVFERIEIQPVTERVGIKSSDTSTTYFDRIVENRKNSISEFVVGDTLDIRLVSAPAGQELTYGFLVNHVQVVK